MCFACRCKINILDLKGREWKKRYKIRYTQNGEGLKANTKEIKEESNIKKGF